MKPTRLLSLTVLTLLLATGCERKSSEVAKQLAELELKANEAVEKQRLLEQQIEEQKLAAERDAIERERMRIDEDRAELERRQGEATAAEEEKIRLRETELANREGRLESQQSALEDKEGDIKRRDAQLDERERELAGREAITREDDRNDEPDVPSADYGMFHDSLSSYGSWFETPDYGYVWQPVIVRDSSWRPYTRGRWVCTDRGWTWISDEPFGWATYHYGRWALCRGYGWIWVPGTEWAPSWVSWRSSGSHIGWAPLPPESLAYRGSRWGSTVDVTFGIGSLWFNFVETRHFGSSIHTHCLPYTQNNLYFGETVNITNIYVQDRRVICGGPRYGDIARQTDRRPPFYRIEEDRHGGPGRDPFAMRPLVSGDRLRVAAPNMDVAWNDGLKPSKVRGRMENIQLERREELRPEVADRFRQSREESRTKADQTIAEHGGNEAFRQHRQQQLETNRRRIQETIRPQAKPADITRRTEEGKTTGKTPDQIGKRDDGPRIHPPKDGGKQEREEAQRRPEQTRPNQDKPNIHPPRDDNRGSQEQADRLRKQQQELAERQREEAQRRQELMRPNQDKPNIHPPKDDNRSNQEQAERQRKQQQELAERQREEAQRRQEQTRNNQDKPNIHPPKDNNRQQQEDAQQRQREQQRQQQAQEEAARQRQEQAQRQQQENAQRQREQARQQQMAEARREQAQRQQQENAQRQREQAQQQQRQEERARQQQEESNRQREQARQQQQEESRREQQRQQQQQAERQREQAQQQQRQEESRREQQRQQQDDDNRKQNGRNR